MKKSFARTGMAPFSLLALCTVMVFPGAASAQDKEEAAGKDSSAAEWIQLTGSESLDIFRQPTGHWTVVGDVSKDPKNERLLSSKPGTGTLVNGAKGKTKHLLTQMEHGDIEAHIEFLVPVESNSGIYFQGRYEIQVLDSWGVKQPRHSDCGGIYQRWNANGGYEGRPPRVNASRKPGEWQSFDVIFRAPRFDSNGKKTAPAVFEKVIHNGVVIHENQELTGPTRSSAFNDEKPLGPLMFQGDHGPVAYRNLRIRPLNGSEDPAFGKARESARIAGISLSKVQRWLHEVALTKIDPKTKLYISHTNGSGRYREALWNYDDAAADTYPFLFWAAWYTDHEKINGPILEVLEAEQRICNHLDRIPTAVNHETLEKVIKSKDNLIFAASEYVKDGLIAIVEVAGKDNPWFERMRAIEDDIWKHADIDTPYGKIPTKNLEANGEQIQALARLFTMTGEKKYLEWAERLADYYLLKGDFLPTGLRDHGCEIIGGLGLLLAVESVHNPAKAKVYLPHIRKMLDQVLEQGTNEDGMMYNRLGGGGLSDGWGYNYVTYLCHDMVVEKPVYQEHLKQTLRNLSKPKYKNYRWEGNHSIDGYADSVEGALYILNRLPVPEGMAWVDREVAANIAYAEDKDRLWTAYKLESNGVRTVLQHALMHTRGLIARPWQQNLELGAVETKEGLVIALKSNQAYQGKLVFDIPRHRIEMGFKQDWPRMNTMPEWFTVEPDQTYAVKDLARESEKTYTGKQLHEGLPVDLQAGEERLLHIKP